MEDLGARVPLIGAPMAGGPTGPALVVAVGRAGGLGFLAAGYKTAAATAEQIAAVRGEGVPFGVNVFAPPVVPVEPDQYSRYARRLRPLAERFQVELPQRPREDDDEWTDKLDLLLRDPVPVVSFTFGLPTADIVDRLRSKGTAVLLTVTSPEEARAAAELRPYGLVVQSAAAGGHLGTLSPAQPPPTTPLAELVTAVRSVTDLPLIGAGGIGSASDVVATIAAGAGAVSVGTALLLADESDTTPVHRSALTDADRISVRTRAFSGRPARGLANAFTDAYSDVAPLGYPALHHLTSPIRRASAAAGNPESVNLWAGTGWRQARSAPAGEIVAELTRLV